MARWLILILTSLTLATPAMAQGRFDGWTTAVISADWRDGRGRPIEAFDNARRDLVSAFQTAGLPRETLVDYTLRTDVADPTTPDAALDGVRQAAARGPNGCLLYFTSHGAPDGLVFGDGPLFAPVSMAQLVRSACGARPTVVIVSACFSGVFLDSLKAPNRMILTAARRDRTSFGCGENDRYPWFDGCILQSLPTAADFLALASATRACVAARETELGAAPPSEPQLFVGSEMQMRLPTLRFTRPTASGGGRPAP